MAMARSGTRSDGVGPPVACKKETESRPAGQRFQASRQKGVPVCHIGGSPGSSLRMVTLKAAVRRLRRLRRAGPAGRPIIMRRSIVVFIVLLVGLTGGSAVATSGAGQTSPVPPFARPSLGPAVAAMASPEKAAIVAAIEMFLRSEDYFDVAALDSVLHPDARGWSTANGEAEHEPWGAYMTWLRSSQPKPAPPDRSRDVRQITSLVHHGDLAQAVLMTRHPWPAGPGITTYWGVQLLKSAGRWTIVGLAGWTDRFDGQTDDRTLDAMAIRPGMTVGEVGAGEGRFTVALSRRVGASGKVYANDIDVQALAALAARCTRLGLGNVEAIPGKVDDAGLPNEAVDVVVMVSVFHHLEKPVALLRNLATALKPGGTVVILDPAYDRTGETDSNRPSTAESVHKEAGEAGFSLVRTESFLPNDNIFVLRPRAGGPAARGANRSGGRDQRGVVRPPPG